MKLPLAFGARIAVLLAFCMTTFVGIQSALGHGVQVGYTTLNNGFIRVYIEHWHRDLHSGHLGGRNAVALTQTVGGNTTSFPNVIPDGFVNSTTIGNLPGAPITVVSACNGRANTYNDWVYYDFPPVSCTEALTVTINAGNSALLTEACSNLYPATIQIGGSGSGLQVLVNTDTNEVQTDVSIEGCNPQVFYPLIATDACDDIPDPVITSVVPPSGSTFATGTTTVTVTTLDAEGNTATHNFDVTVTEPAGGCCPPDLGLVASASSPYCPGGSDGSIDLSVGDGEAPFSFSWSNGATTEDLNGISAGDYTVNVTDANGCTDTLTVSVVDGVDNEDPTFTCPDGVTLECDGSGYLAQITAWADDQDLEATDNCGVGSEGYTLDLDADCGLTGSGTATFTVMDVNGNSSSCTVAVEVVDTTAPDVSLVVADILPSEVPVSFTATSNGDVCGTTTVTISSVTCQAYNGAGKLIDKSESCEYTIDGDTITITDGGGVGTFITIVATAVDECGNATSTEDQVVHVLRPANEGVGNGVDGNTPGHDNNGGNDDPGNGPGNPGAKGGKKNR